MASSFAWLSVLIKQNLKVIRPRTVVKCSWEDTFGMLLGKLEIQAEVTVEKERSVQMTSLWMHT